MLDKLAYMKAHSNKLAKIKKNLLLISMALPGVIWFILLRYIPMFGIILAFKDYKIYTKSPSFINNLLHSKWVGLKNFKFLFATTDSWIMIRNTIGYNALWIVLGIVIAVAFAIMINEISNRFVAKTYQTLMFFPYFLSWVVASYFLLTFLDPTRGLISNMQRNLGMQVTNWYNDPKPWPIILTIMYLWKNIGYSTVLYLAAITGIDMAQYEAASIEGASKWQQIWHITIPNIRPIITILFIMNVGKIFNADFGLFYSVPMNSGPLFPTTQVIDTYVYRALMGTNNPGMSAAAGLMQNVVGCVCLIAANFIVKKLDEESGLF